MSRHNILTTKEILELDNIDAKRKFETVVFVFENALDV